MRRLFMIFIAITALMSEILFLAGCGNNDKTLSVMSQIPKQTIRVSVMFNGDELAKFQETLDSLNAGSSDYKFEIQDIALGNYNSELDVLLNTNSAPDIIMYDSGNKLNGLIKQGKFLEITKQIKNDTRIKRENYFISLINQVTYNNKLYGLPFDCIAQVLFFNKDMFDMAGISYPAANWTWEDFRKTAKKLTMDIDGDGKIDQWGFGQGDSLPWYLIIPSFGGDLGKIGSNESINALNLLSDIINKDKSVVPNDNNSSFNNGNVGMSFSYVSSSLNYDFNYGIAQIPYEKNKVTSMYIRNFLINAKTKKIEIAYKALVDLSLSYKYDTTLFLPAQKNGFDLTLINELGQNYDVNVIENTLNDYYYPANIDDNVFTLIRNNVIRVILNGTKTVAEAIKNMPE